MKKTYIVSIVIIAVSLILLLGVGFYKKKNVDPFSIDELEKEYDWVAEVDVWSNYPATQHTIKPGGNDLLGRPVALKEDWEIYFIRGFKELPLEIRSPYTGLTVLKPAGKDVSVNLPTILDIRTTDGSRGKIIVAGKRKQLEED